MWKNLAGNYLLIYIYGGAASKLSYSSQKQTKLQADAVCMCNPVTTFGGRRASSGTQPTMAAANSRLDCFLIFELIRFPSFFSPSPAHIHSECGPTRPSHVVNPNLHRPPAAKHLCQDASSSGQRPTKPIPAAVWRSLLSSNNRCCNCPHAAESRKPTIF